ncbi:MAG TPA: aldehyde dehydrogenase family protein, partial [Umezawaea sp.]|nr:aldehyde dehydrogenase family protein [Umezawaea sp.]
MSPGNAYTSTSPLDVDDVVASIELEPASALVEAARRAKAAQRAWAAVPAPVRGQVVGNIGRLVSANSEALARLVTREIGKPLAEARGEVQ